ncbi:helix-turn-helix transcriptional regulator [bacterium]|nr:helix-turn-helix transcriptional regulator [bacterium]
MRPLPYRCVLRGDTIREHIDRANENQKSAAGQAGISKSYFSQLLSGRREATPWVRKKIRACPLFRSLPDDALWERIPLAQDDPDQRD